MQAKVVQVGNSKGIRLPKRLIAKYGLGETVVITELSNGLLIEGSDDMQLTWAETYKEIAKSGEDGSDWAGLDVEAINEG